MEGLVTDFLDCAKPLIFGNAEPEFLYSMQGTCFLAKVGRRAYVITAQHCLKGRSLDSLRIRLRPGVLEFLRLGPMRFPDGQGEDCADLAIAEIVAGSISPADLASKNFLDLNRYRAGPSEASESSILAVVGYPSGMNTIDYDESSLNTQVLSFDGRYCGPSEERECSKIRINSLGSLAEMDGLSGSPVIEFMPNGENRYRRRFAGVFIRGTAEALCGRFVNAPAVYKALEL